MRRTVLVLVATVMAIVSIAAVGRAEPAAGDSLRRWGVGWDSGIAMRYRPCEAWGIGLSFSPYLTKNDGNSRGTQQSSTAPDRIDQTTNDSNTDSRSVSVSALVFREARVLKWLRIGPFASIGYSYSHRDNSNGDGREFRADTLYSVDRRVFETGSQSRTWSFAVGIRPTFTLENRFVLETRFGLEASYDNTDNDTRNSDESTSNGGATPQDRSSVNQNRGGDDGWNISVFGQNLGPGAVLAFVVYF